MKLFRPINLFILLFLLFGIFFRLYGLTWGNPYFFNPDERSNVAYPIIATHDLLMLDQKNFDIGTLPLIVIKNIANIFSHNNSHINQYDVGTIIFIGRGVSVVFSLGILLFLYLTTTMLGGKRAGILALFLGTFSVGFIEFSHFTTIELWEAFFFLVLFYFNCRIIKYMKFRDGIITGIIFGLALATKLLSAFLILPIFLGLVILLFRKTHSTSLITRIKKGIIFLFVSYGIAGIVFLLLSSQILFHFKDFYNSIHFESGVATGSIPIFFTQSFYKTIPVLFQFMHVYPFLINPFLTIVFIFSFFFLISLAVKQKNIYIALLLIYYILFFLTQAFLFVKWTRYMIPTLPFIYIIIALTLARWIDQAKKIHAYVAYISTFFLLVISYIFAHAFFITVYTHIDTRVSAATYAKIMIPKHSKIVIESYDPGDGPFKKRFTNILDINTYYLEQDLQVEKDISQKLAQADYLVLLSPRLLRARLRNPTDFPKGYMLYNNLLEGKSDFAQMYQTPCDLFCKIVYIGDPVFALEETATVFDRPTVFIFAKNKN